MYEKFFAIEAIVEFFKAMDISGITKNMIEAYPKLNESKEMYQKISKSIQNFKTTKTLMK